MTPTTKKVRSEIDKKSQPSKQVSQKESQGKNFSKQTSLGSRLLILVVGSALLGLGGLGYFFYQELLKGAKQEIEEKLSSQVNLIESKLNPVQQSVLGLAASGRLLNRQGIKDPEVYKQLVFEHFKTLNLAIAIGIGQAPNQLVPERKWYYPYFYRDQKDVKVDQKVGARLAAPNNNVLFSDLFTGDNYPEKDYYKQPVAAAKGLWMEPYEFYGISMTTYIMPFYNDANQLLGVVGADVNVTTLGETFGGSVISDAGYFTVVSSTGNLLTYPPEPPKAKNRESYQSIPELNSVWPKLQERSAGLVQTEGKFWAYRKVPSSGWSMIAVVPESTILGRVLLITVGTTTAVAALLTLAVLWFISNLNRRLKPILDECDKLAEAKGGALTVSKNEDEIERLTISFQNLIEQITTSEERIKEEVGQTVQAQEQLNQSRQSELEANLQLENEIGGLLDVVSSLEEGDLTVQAEVSDRATGLVADTLNRLREQLAEIIARVLGTAQQVASGAKDLEELARTVALNTVEEAQSVAQGQALTEQVATLAQNSVSQVSKANQSLLTVQATVEDGQIAINTLIEGITVLQKGTAQIVQRMKTLGEFVGLAEQFVQDQGQIASLTQVLAINATLVAARAAEQRDPKQFIGVAREFEAIAGQVNSLATQTNEGLSVLQQRTAQIQSVVSAVDAEVQNLGGLVAGFNIGVDQSQKAFYSVRKVTEQVVELGQNVTESSFAIADAADSTAKYIGEIASLAEQTASLTSTARLQAETIGDLAERLLQGIQFFRLPTYMLPKAEPKLIGTAVQDETSSEFALSHDS